MTVFSRQKLQIETGDYESIIGVGRLRWSPCQEFLCRGISCRSKDNRENRNPFTEREGEREGRTSRFQGIVKGETFEVIAPGKIIRNFNESLLNRNILRIIRLFRFIYLLYLYKVKFLE